MKALLREKGETVTEEMKIPGIDWKTGAPLTNDKWFGGPYKLVDNYVPPVDEEENATQPEQPEDEEEIVKDDYVIIDGKKYNKEELRSLLK